MRKVFSFLIFFISILLGCGVKGGPYPPYTKSPETVKTVLIKQQDQDLIVYWRYIPRYADGRYMKENFRFEVFSFEHRVVKKINKSGNLYWFRYSFSHEREYCFRFRVLTEKNKSRFSRYFCYIPTLGYPKTKPDFEIKIVEKGIKLKWKNNNLKTNLYKGKEKTLYPVPYISLSANQYLDENVSNGKKYCYYITYEDNNGVESPPSDIKCRIFKDIFPPEPPKNPKLIEKDGQFYLVWTESRSKDTVGYIIEINGKALNKIPVKTYIFKIPEYKKGSVIKIYAVDKAGNKSKPAILK